MPEDQCGGPAPCPAVVRPDVVARCDRGLTPPARFRCTRRPAARRRLTWRLSAAVCGKGIASISCRPTPRRWPRRRINRCGVPLGTLHRGGHCPSRPSRSIARTSFSLMSKRSAISLRDCSHPVRLILGIHQGEEDLLATGFRAAALCHCFRHATSRTATSRPDPLPHNWSDQQSPRPLAAARPADGADPPLVGTAAARHAKLDKAFVDRRFTPPTVLEAVAPPLRLTGVIGRPVVGGQADAQITAEHVQPADVLQGEAAAVLLIQCVEPLHRDPRPRPDLRRALRRNDELPESLDLSFGVLRVPSDGTSGRPFDIRRQSGKGQDWHDLHLLYAAWSASPLALDIWANMMTFGIVG